MSVGAVVTDNVPLAGPSAVHLPLQTGFSVSPSVSSIEAERSDMQSAKLQKMSLVALAWWLLHLAALSLVHQIVVWPPEIAAFFAERYTTDVRPPLPLWAVLFIYGIPTLLVAGLVWLYRVG